MSQYMRPISDINSGWSRSTGTYRYALIDEEIPNDSDYIYSSSDNAYQECKLSPPSEVPDSGGGILRVRIRRATGSSSVNSIGAISLRVGSTVIKTTSSIYTTETYSTQVINLTEAEMANITDWSDVRVRCVANIFTYSPANVYVSWIEFQVPNAPFVPSLGLEMGCNF